MDADMNIIADGSNFKGLIFILYCYYYSPKLITILIYKFQRL